MEGEEVIKQSEAKRECFPAEKTERILNSEIITRQDSYKKRKMVV
jgi:hypothetical protein